ncbi:hypothetical protein O6H91_Y212300 [Diphasiastrum complanatum]|nr:hypothetical protein O6H91_Y212300 [Diphasiastrum complanatum]
MVDVAKALARPPSYTTKYFGCELGAQSKFDDKTGTALVNGAHETAKLAGLMENFIKKYVQCYGCGNPETEIVISKTQLITLKCAACGFVSDVDMRDKLTTFILKNPPEQKKSGKDKKGMRRAEKERLKEGEVADEELKKVKKDVKKKKGQDDEKRVSKKKSGGSEDEQLSPVASQADDDEDQEEDDGVQWQTDTSAEAAKRRIKEQLTSATSEMVMIDEPESSPRAKDVKDKEIKSKPKKEVAKKSDTVASQVKDQDLPRVEALSLHNTLVKEFKAFLKNGSTPAELASIVHSKDSSMQEVFCAYFQALFDGISKGLAKEVGKKKLYLTKVVHDETSQKLLLDAVEVFCIPAGPDMSKEVPLVLKTLYDEEIVEEEQIMEWFDKGGSNAGGGLKSGSVRKYAQPFVEWLRNAEAESDEE